MSYHKFGINDIFYNTIEAYPEYVVHIYNNKTYINSESNREGRLGTKTKGVSHGEISLYEMNIDRDSSNLIYPFVTKEGARTAFKTVSTSEFDNTSQYQYGDEIAGKYPLSSSITRIYIPAGPDLNIFNFQDAGDNSDYVPAHKNKKYITALKATLNKYSRLSNSFDYAVNSLGTSIVNMVCVPSIFYGSSIKKGSVVMKFNISGSTVAEISDINKNGEMIQTTGSSGNKDKVAGVVLYDEGLVLLTGSWDLSNSSTPHTENYNAGGNVNPKWIYFGAGMYPIGVHETISGIVSSSFEFAFQGISKIPTLTMLAHAEAGSLNYSNNPTFVEKDTTTTPTYNLSAYMENEATIKNITKSKYANHTASFKKNTYITKIGIYDDQKNLIAIANIANPVKKEEEREYTFKLKLDF